MLAGCGAPPALPDAAAAPAYPRGSALVAPFIKDLSHFGSRVALSGDGRVVAIGVPRDDSGQVGVASDGTDRSTPAAGSVYIFEAGPMGWQAQAYLKPGVAGEADQFGASLGLSTLGDTLVVGAPGEGSSATGVGGDPDDNSASGAGAAYVFKRHGAQWMQEAYLKASNTDGGDELGLAVAIAGDGNTVAVGAPNESSNGTDQSNNAASDAGAVYVYATDGTMWTQQAYVKAASPAPLDAFGGALALSANGATLAVGTSAETAYVFTRSGLAWSQQAQLQAATATLGDGFGAALALSGLGMLLAVGAPHEDGHGAAYVFAGPAWTPAAHLATATDGDLLGAALAISADGAVVAVSAPDDDATAMDSGAIHVFGAPAWSEAAQLKAPVPMSGMGFGSSISLSSSGVVLAVGVPLASSNGLEAGAVDVFY